MDQVRVAVGSTRRPKLSAVTEALQSLGALLAPGAEFEVVGFDVGSGVSHTPVRCEELMRGARQRSEAVIRVARQTSSSWRFFVGLEGGLEVLKEHARRENGERCVLLESWAYVSDGVRGYYGRSGGVELPDALAHEVLENGLELSVAIDRFAGAAGIRDAQGAWGVLSRNMITRQEAFRVAVIAAFAPFYNSEMYRRVER